MQKVHRARQIGAVIEAAWEEEIARRIAEIDSGKAKLVPADEVFAEVRRLIKWQESTRHRG